jgi:glycosyltransferase involved in cell wall biosynthesis
MEMVSVQVAMKVSFIVRAHLSDDNGVLIGGASKNPYRLVKFLSRAVEVKRVIYFEGAHSGSELYSAHRFRMPLKLYAKTVLLNLISSWAVWRAFKDSDIVQCHHPHYGLVAAFLRRCVFRKVLLVVKAHGTGMPELLANKYGGVKGAILRLNAALHLWHDRFVLARADSVLCSSEFQRQEMCEVYGIDRYKTRCIYNGYDPELLGRAAAVATTRDVYRLVFCGRVVPKKGAEQAIDLFESLAGDDDKYRLVLILGKRAAIEDPKTYRRILERARSDARISILHDVSEIELYRQFFQAAVGLITSNNYESIPTVLIEMLSAGMTVFATYCWGIPELLLPAYGLSGSVHADAERVRSSWPTGTQDPCKMPIEHLAYPSLVHSYIALYRELLSAPE